MVKENVRNLCYGKCLYKTLLSEVFEIRDGYVVKFIPRLVLEAYKEFGGSLEKKIQYADDIVDMAELYKPTSAIYTNEGFCGYTMLENKGINFNDYDNTLTLEQRSDLKRYAFIYKQLENIVKKGHSQAKKIIFPDLASCDNIYIDQNLKVSLIDYDGLQIGDQFSDSYSSNLGNEEDYYVPKYKSGLFYTEEIDKTSLTILYFLDAFNVDLKMIGKTNPLTGKTLTIEDVFEAIRLDDKIFIDKVKAILSKNEYGAYIGEDIDRIADKYIMKTLPLPDGRFMKKLIKK